jgi:Ca-activated chloride channel homolog
VSFGSPLWLLALALIPLALLAQRAARQRARRYALRFPAAGTVAKVVGPRSVWSGRLPAATFLAALALLALTLARPRGEHRVPVGQASIELVLDHSGSMASTDVSPTRIQAAIRAANTFIDELPSTIKVGAVTFSTTPDQVQAPSADHDEARQVIDNQTADGGTDTGPALQMALQVLHGSEKHHPPAAIVLLSDGAANLGVSPVVVAQQAKEEGIQIDTVALGTPGGVLNEGPFNQAIPVPPDPQLMDAIARTSGGRSFDAQSSDELSSIYQELGDRLGTVKRNKDVTADFALAAAILLIGAATLSVRASGRLP